MIRTIKVTIPDFCQEECAAFKLKEQLLDFCGEDGEWHTEHLYSCNHEDFCKKTHKAIEKQGQLLAEAEHDAG